MTGFTSRLRWADLDPVARGAVEQAVHSATGAVVSEALDVHGGMSPGPAAVVTTDDGQEVFVKVTSSDLNEKSCRLYRDEIAAYRALAHLELPMPTLLSVVEHGSWVGLVLTRAPGRTPGPPWDAAALSDVREASAQVSGVTAPDALPPVLHRLPQLDGWEALATDPLPLGGWLARNAGRCADLVRGWETWTAGTTLAHNDLRCDNVVWSPDENTTLVDWNFASAAASWLDVAQLAADVMASGIEGEGEDAASALDLSLGLLSAAPEDASRFVLALAGMLRRNSTLPPHPALPTMRAWQAARADRMQPLVEALVPALLS